MSTATAPAPSPAVPSAAGFFAHEAFLRTLIAEKDPAVSRREALAAARLAEVEPTPGRRAARRRPC